MGAWVPVSSLASSNLHYQYDPDVTNDVANSLNSKDKYGDSALVLAAGSGRSKAWWKLLSKKHADSLGCLTAIFAALRVRSHCAKLQAALPIKAGEEKVDQFAEFAKACHHSLVVNRVLALWCVRFQS